MEMQIWGDDLECCEALAELLALCQRIVVRGLVDDQALIGVDDSVCVVGTLYPVAHPLAVTPAVRAEQSDLAAGNLALQLVKIT